MEIFVADYLKVKLWKVQLSKSCIVNFMNDLMILNSSKKVFEIDEIEDLVCVAFIMKKLFFFKGIK